MAPRTVFLCCLFTRGPIKKHDDLVGVVLLEPLAGQFIYFSDSLVLPGEISGNPAEDQGGVGEGKPSPRFSFGGGWEGGFDQLISSRIYTPEAKASADLRKRWRSFWYPQFLGTFSVKNLDRFEM